MSQFNPSDLVTYTDFRDAVLRGADRPQLNLTNTNLIRGANVSGAKIANRCFGEVTHKRPKAV